MRLANLNPGFVDAGGEGISNADGSPVPKRTGIGLVFDCPCDKPCGELCFVHFENPLDGGPARADGHPRWVRTGTTFEELTLTPSILRNPDKGGCGWHGFITNGEVVDA